MNLLNQSLRQLNLIRNSIPRIFTTEYSLFSTAINPSPENTAVVTKDASVPDKLYKRVELEIRANEPAILKSYSWFSTTAAKHLGIEVEKSWPMRKSHKERHTLLKSAFVHKKHRVQYEIRTYFHFIHLNKLTQSTCETYLEYLERNLPEGVGMKITKVEIQRMPEHLLEPPTNNKAE